MLEPVPTASIHQADTTIVSGSGDCDGTGDMGPAGSAGVVDGSIPALLSQDTLVFYTRTERSLILVIIIIIFQIHNDITKPD